MVAILASVGAAVLVVGAAFGFYAYKNKVCSKDIDKQQEDVDLEMVKPSSNKQVHPAALPAAKSQAVVNAGSLKGKLRPDEIRARVESRKLNEIEAENSKGRRIGAL